MKGLQFNLIQPSSIELFNSDKEVDVEVKVEVVVELEVKVEVEVG